MIEQTDSVAASRPSNGPSADRAKLFLSGIGAPVSADVHHRSPSRLTVRRELQFLRVGTAVTDEEGRHATISSVRVYVENDVPTLIMDLRYPSDRARREGSLPVRTSGNGDRTGVRDEPTVVFGTEPDSHPRIVSSSSTFLEDLVANLRRFVGLVIRVSRGVRLALASESTGAAVRSASHVSAES